MTAIRGSYHPLEIIRDVGGLFAWAKKEVLFFFSLITTKIIFFHDFREGYGYKRATRPTSRYSSFLTQHKAL